MRMPEGSKRTRIIFRFYSAVLAVAVALVFWLFATLMADFLGKAVPTFALVNWLAVAVVPLLALRLALAWSMKSERGVS